MPEARRLLDDESELVRAMAVWALSRLASKEEFAKEKQARQSAEDDPQVRAEWAAG
ncbi:MAG: HEAT repeat domain-containing protein [Rhodovibrionaceae bacterium]|nr:HEAT repeat domain-containing protein [Rhodovibrionaceae bacterium]